MISATDIIQKIRQEAYDIGFLEIGFVKPHFLEEGKFLKKWIGAGYHGGMDWIVKSAEKRINPHILYPEIKTIISTVISYYSPYKLTEKPGMGRIARHAACNDYHVIVKEKLETLLHFIKKIIPGAEGKTFVDSSPLLEKIWAVKAGLGWIGKNSLLLTERAGSWVLIGDILLDKELTEEKKPVQDLCGKCRKCMDACPTGAIVEPRVIDVTRCISYLTQSKRDIPDGLKKKMNRWIYGCEICQEVCPRNESPEETKEKGFLLCRENTEVELRKLLQMDEEEFKRRFEGTVIGGKELSIIKRNIKNALENIS